MNENKRFETSSWKSFQISEIFEITDGFTSSNLDISPIKNKYYSIPFLRPSKSYSIRNGYLNEKDVEKLIFPAFSLIMGNTGHGSHTYSYLVTERFVPNNNLSVLLPKNGQVSYRAKLFLIPIIKYNRYRYCYGRIPNMTRFKLSQIKLPVNKKGEPDWQFMDDYIKTIDEKISKPSKKPFHDKEIKIEPKTWKKFKFTDIFEIKKGYYNKKPPHTEHGEIPFLGATANNNGVTSRCTLEDVRSSSGDGSDKNDSLGRKIFPGNCISVTNNGSVGYAFYQKNRFTCSHDVNPLYLKDHDLNSFIAMFICSVIEKDRYRWAYGRKWRPKRMIDSTLSLPADKNGKPDWQFMEDYIKSLPYSGNLE